MHSRYSRLQVASVLILSVGIIISALGDAKSKVGVSVQP